MGKAPTGQNSPVLATGCSNKSQAEADSLMRSRVNTTDSAERPAGAMVGLMVWYPDQNYGGYSNVIYGYDGVCDGGGYRIIPSQYWQVNLSSIKRVNTCDRATLFNRALNQQGTFPLDTPIIGSFDNNVGKVQVFSSYA